MIRKYSDKMIALIMAVAAYFSIVGVGFADAATSNIDWSTTFQPVQDTVMQAILAAIAIGVVIFGAVFGIRKLISVLKGVAK